jgi:hypothetical protein
VAGAVKGKQMTNIYTVKLLKNGQLIQQQQVHTALAEKTGATRIKAQADVVYLLVSENSQKSVPKIVTKRVGNHLHLVLDGNTKGQPQLIIEDYFARANQNSALATQSFEGELVLFTADNPAQMASVAKPNQVVVQTAKGAEATWWHSSGVQLGLIAGGLYAVSAARAQSNNGDSASNAQDGILSYAAGNTTVAPTVARYHDAGYLEVTSSNVGAMNSALQRTHAKDNATVQKIIEAYLMLFDIANGNSPDTSAKDPELANYHTLGIVLLNLERSDNPNGLKLFTSILKGRTSGEINTVTKLDNLAIIADKVSSTAKGDTQLSPLTALELNSIGLSKVTDANLAAIRSALAASADDGSGVTSLEQLIAIEAAYVKVLAQANGTRGDTTESSKTPTASELQSLGVTLGKAGMTDDPQQANALKLLNDVIDGLSNASVDTVSEISALTATVDKVMAVAKATTSAEAIAVGLTVNELTALGLTGVTTDNLAEVVEAIRLTQSSDGSKINNAKQLQSATDLGVVMHYAESSPTASTGHVAPTLAQYLSVGLKSVDEGNNKAINPSNLAALNSAVEALTANDVNSLAELQALVNIFAKLLQMADGIKNTNDPLTLVNLLGIGALKSFNETTGFIGGSHTAKAATPDSAQKDAALSLLNDVIDARSISLVDSIAEINLLSVSVDKVIDQASATPSTTLKVSDFVLLGIQNVNETNLAQVILDLQAASTNQFDGQNIDTLAEIQSQVSLAQLQLYAENPSNALPSTPKDLTQVYKDLTFNSTSIKWTDALAASVSSTVNHLSKNDITQPKLVEVGVAFQKVLNEATGGSSNNNPDPTASDYKLILKLPTETTTLHLYETADNDNTTTSLADNALALLNDWVRQQSGVQAITVGKLDKVTKAVDRVMELAAASNTNNNRLTADDLFELGLARNSGWSNTSVVSSDGFVSIVAASIDDGSAVNSIQSLQDIISRSATF